MRNEPLNVRLLTANTLLVSVIFVGDLVIPLGIAGGVLYVVVVLLAMWLPSRFVYLFAVICSGLTLIGLFASPEGGPLLTAAANRALSVLAIWVAAVLGLHRKRLSGRVLRQAKIIDQVRDAVITTDMHGYVTFWNSGAEAIFGYTDEEMVGRSIGRLFDSGWKDVFAEQVMDTLLKDGSDEQETWVRTKTGQRVLTRQWLLLRRDEKDDPTGVMLHVSDVTRRREAEKAAARMETFYQYVLNELPLQIAIFDTEGRFLYINPASLSDTDMRDWIVGRTEQEYFETVGRNIEAAEERKSQREKAIRRKEAVSYEEEFVTASGEFRSYLHGFTPVVDETGEVTKVLGYRYDITDHKRTAWALQESLARLKTILETAGDGIMTVNEDGLIESYNRTARRLHGYPAEEVIGEHIDTLLKPVPSDGNQGFHAEYLIGGGTKDAFSIGEFTANRKDGSIFPVEVAMSEFQLEGKRFFTVILRDLTNRKLTERALTRYNERLEALRQIDQAILTAQSVKAVAQVAVRHLLQMVPANEALVALFDASTESALILTVHKNGSVVGPDTMALDEFQRSTSTSNQNGQYGLGASERRSDNSSRSDLSCLEIPLRVKGTDIGMLCLAPDGGESFELEHQAIAREVAGPLAVAIQDARLFEEVDQSRERLRSLSQRLVQIQEKERHHIARELHDEIGQALTGLKLLLETLDTTLEKRLEEPILEAKSIVMRLLGRVRDLSLDLRPAMLDDLGLLPALLWLTNRYSTRTGITVDFKHSGLEKRFDPEVETAAYRIVQEALTNVARHSGAQRAGVKVLSSGEELVVSVRDDGSGFDMRQAMTGISSGLSGMQERASSFGGDLQIETGYGEGTSLTARLPSSAKTVNKEEE